MSGHLLEFATLMAVFALAAVTPGPDFAMVVRQSVVHGRRAGIATSFGVGSGILLHTSYTVAGIGLVVAHSVLAFNVLKWLGAAYLIYVGIKTLRAEPPRAEADMVSGVSTCDKEMPASDLRCFALGFLTNALNPKAVLFFLSLFTTVVSAATPLALQFGYGCAMSLLLVGWYSMVSVFFTGRAVREQLTRIGRWFNRLAGGALIALGCRLALQRAQLAG